MATVHWTDGRGGVWSSAADWSDGAVPGLGRIKGRVGIQKHTGMIRYRNIEIMELPD